MIDFNNGEYVKLRQINNKDGLNATADFHILYIFNYKRYGYLHQ